MASMGFPVNKVTIVLAILVFLFLWFVTEEHWLALLLTVGIFIGLYILFVILAQLFG